METPGQVLRKLTIRDDALLRRLAAEQCGRPAESSLDPKTHALVCIVALIAMDAAAPSYLCAVESARAAGASDEEIVGCLTSVPRSKRRARRWAEDAAAAQVTSCGAAFRRTRRGRR